MDARAKSLRFLGEGKQLTIPFFQRSYVWKEENWKELLNSFDNNDVVPFLGSIIVKDVPDPFNPGERMVIDGQQRLTTITILAKAILDSLPRDSRNESGITDDVKAFLFYKVNASDKFKVSRVRIQHSRLDNDMYEKVIRAGLFSDAPLSELEAMDPKTSKITECYFFFRKELKDKTEDELEQLHNSIFSDERKIFVLIALGHNDVNEQSIFDTINRAGVRLSTADIIKNALFKACLDRAKQEGIAEQNVLDLYDEYWNKVFYETKERRQQWDTTRIFGNVERTNLEFLLYCVATIKWGKHKYIFSNLDLVYSEKTAGYTYSQLAHLVHEINEYATLFFVKVLEFQTALSTPETLPILSFGNHVERLLLILEKFGVQMFYPFVLKRIVDAQYNYHDESLLHDFRILESFVVRRRISGRGVTDYAIKCDQIIHEPQGLQNVLVNELVSETGQINDRDFAAGCSKIKNTETAKIILFCIELYRRQDPKYDYDSLYYNYSLEHIMPRKWEKYWSDVPVYNEDGSVFAGAEADKKAVRDKAIQSLGNYALLKEKLNTSVSNRAFDIKINGNGKHKGYRKYTSLLTTGELVDAFDEGKCEWNEKTIRSRAAALIKEAICIWPAFAVEATVQPMNATVEATPATTVSVSVDDLSGEAFDDPLKMLKEMDQMANSQSLRNTTQDANAPKEMTQHHDEQRTTTNNESVEKGNMISLEEFVVMVSAQPETIERYVREGKIVADATVSVSEHRDRKYFKLDTVKSYVEQFGWVIIDDTNRKQLFMDMVRQMDMSYSYKPVFLKAVLKHADNEGCVKLDRVVSYVLNYYKKRRNAGVTVEKDNSVFVNPDCSVLDVEKVILKYPYDRFRTMQVLTLDAENAEIRFNKNLWEQLSDNEKMEIEDICDQKLIAYFSRL